MTNYNIMKEIDKDILRDGMLDEIKKLENAFNEEKSMILETLNTSDDSLYQKEIILDGFKYLYLLRCLLEDHLKK